MHLILFVCYVISVISDSATLWTVCSSPGSSVHGILQARILAVGYHASGNLLQRVFLTQGWNLPLLCLLYW